MTAAVTPLGRRTTFPYDDRGLPVERHDPGGGVWRYEHSAAGRLTARHRPDRSAHRDRATATMARRRSPSTRWAT